MQYPVTVIEKNPVRWNQDGQTIEYTPQFKWVEGTTDKVESVGNTCDVKDLFADYAALSKQLQTSASNSSSTQEQYIFKGC